MNLIIRIPLPVDNLSALAGFYTDGPSMMSLYGLVSQLEEDARFAVTRFGLAVEAYEARHAESLTTGLDLLERGKQREAVRPSTGYRYANIKAALYLETEAIDGDDLQDLLQCIEASVNARRVQGGNLVEYVSADPSEPVHMATAIVRTAGDAVAFIAKHEKPLTALYLSAHLPAALQGYELVEAYAEALTRKDTLMVCHGYVQVGSVQDAAGQPRLIAEPSYTLVETVQVHALKKLEYTEQSAALTRFFWSFDHKLQNENPAVFLLT